MRFTVLVTTALIAIGASVPVTAQEAYPQRPVIWVVPFAAGGATDVFARTIANRVSDELGQNIIVENIAGAGGTIGAENVARAEPDGYTFLVGNIGQMAAAPSLYGQLRYDPLADFVPVFRFPDTPMALVANPASPFETTADLVAFAREHPGELSFSNAGLGSSTHLVVALFAAEAGISVESIPYQGAGQALNAVMGGEVDAMFDQTNTSLPQIRSGMLKPLGVTSPEPNEQIPGADPIGAEVVPGFEVATWYGIYAPSGTPDVALETLLAAYLRAMEDETFTSQLTAQGIVLHSEEQYRPEQLRQYNEAEIERWAGVIEEAGISFE